MKSLYEPSDYMIGQYRCVAIDNEDRMVSGDSGWIFEAGPGRLGIVVLEKDKVARRAHPGSYPHLEQLSYCNLKDLKDRVSAIGVLRDLSQAAYYANNPNARHDLALKKEGRL